MERDIRWRAPTWCFVLVGLIAGILSQASFPSQFQPQPYFGTLNQQQQPVNNNYNFMPTAPTLYAQAFTAQANRPCDITQDLLLVKDADDATSFYYLKCQPVGDGTGNGYWQRKECQIGQTFDFFMQQCRASTETNMQQQWSGQQQPQNIYHGLPQQPTYSGQQPFAATQPSVYQPQITYGGQPFGQQPTGEWQTGDSSIFTNNVPHGQRSVHTIPDTAPVRPVLLPTPTANSHTADQLLNLSLKLAIIGQSCATGETCLGGSICSRMTFQCECPPETITNTELFVCEDPETGDVATKHPTTIFPEHILPTEPTQPVFSRPQTTLVEPTLLPPTTTPVFSRPPTRPIPTHTVPTITIQTITTTQATAQPGATCTRGERCIGGSQCISGECRCVEGTKIYRDGTCTKLGSVAAAIGQECGEFHRCTRNSTCISGQCMCPKDTIYDGRNCVAKPERKVVGAGASCANSEICGKGSVCNPFAKRCMCPIGTLQRDDECRERTMVERSTVGTSCKYNHECIDGAYCDIASQTCQCLSTHVSLDNQCVKVVRPGQGGCKMDEQCMATDLRATCEAGVCTCVPGTRLLNQMCVDLGQRATTTAPRTRSTTTTPRPTKPVLENNDTNRNAIHQLSLPGDACEKLSHCGGGAICKFGYCVCPAGQAVFARQCVYIDQLRKQNNTPKAKRLEVTDEALFETPVGFFCLQEQRTCARGLGRCVHGYCRCRPGMTVTSNNMCMVMAPNSTVGDYDVRLTDTECDPARPCPGYQRCHEGRCRCPHGFVASGRVCINESNSALRGAQAIQFHSVFKRPHNLVGTACRTRYDCRSPAECFNGVCMFEDQIREQLTTLAATPYNARAAPVTDTTMTQTSTSTLIGQGNATPATDATTTKTETSTLIGQGRATPIGERCTAIETCTGGASCVSGRCQCTDGSQQEGQVCMQAPGGLCTAG